MIQDFLIKQFKEIADILQKIPQPQNCSQLNDEQFKALTNINTAKAKANEMAQYIQKYGLDYEKEYVLNFNEKDLQVISFALDIAKENADEIDTYDAIFDGEEYTHSDFEEDCINMLETISDKLRSC